MGFEPITYWSEAPRTIPTALLPLSVLAEQCTVTEGFHTHNIQFYQTLALGSVQYRVFDSLLRFVQKKLILTFRDRSQFRGGGRERG